MVKRSILGQEAKSRHEPTGVPEANHPRAADASVRVTVQVHDVPADDDGTGGEAAHRDQTDAEVSHVETPMGRQQDREAGRGEQEAQEDEWESEAEAVGQVGQNQAESQRRRGWWDRMQLGLHGRVAEGLDYGRSKVGVG